MKRRSNAPNRITLSSFFTGRSSNREELDSQPVTPATPVSVNLYSFPRLPPAHLREATPVSPTSHGPKRSPSRVWRWVREQKVSISARVTPPATDFPSQTVAFPSSDTASLYSDNGETAEDDSDWPTFLPIPPPPPRSLRVRRLEVDNEPVATFNFIDVDVSLPASPDAVRGNVAFGEDSEPPPGLVDDDTVDPVLPVDWEPTDANSSSAPSTPWTERRPLPRPELTPARYPTVGSLSDLTYDLPTDASPSVWHSSRSTSQVPEVPPVPAIPERFLAQRTVSGVVSAPTFPQRAPSKQGSIRPKTAPGACSTALYNRDNSATPKDVATDTAAVVHTDSLDRTTRKRSAQRPASDSSTRPNMSSLATTMSRSHSEWSVGRSGKKPMLLRAPASVDSAARDSQSSMTGGFAPAPIHARFARTHAPGPSPLYPMRSLTATLASSNVDLTTTSNGSDPAASIRFLASGHSTPYSTRSRSPVPTIGRADDSRATSPVPDAQPHGTTASTYHSIESGSAGTREQASTSRHQELTLGTDRIASLVRLRVAAGSPAHSSNSHAPAPSFYNDHDADSDLEPPVRPFARANGSRRNSSSSSIDSAHGHAVSTKSSIDSGVSYDPQTGESSSGSSHSQRMSRSLFTTPATSSAPTTPISGRSEGPRFFSGASVTSKKDQRSTGRTSLLIPTMVSAPLQTLPSSAHPSFEQDQPVERARSPIGSPLKQGISAPAAGMGFAAPRRASLVPIAKPLIEPPSLATLSTSTSSQERPRGRDTTPRGRPTDTAPTSFGLDKLLGRRRHSVSKDSISGPLPVEVGEAILQEREEASARPSGRKRFLAEPTARSGDHSRSPSPKPPSLDPTYTPSESTMNLHEHLRPSTPPPHAASGSSSPNTPSTSSPSTPIRSHHNPYALKQPKPSIEREVWDRMSAFSRVLSLRTTPTSPTASTAGSPTEASAPVQPAPKRKPNKLIRGHSRTRSQQGNESDADDARSSPKKDRGRTKGALPPSAFRGDDVQPEPTGNPDDTSVSSFGMEAGDPFKKLPRLPREQDGSTETGPPRRPPRPANISLDDEQTPSSTPMQSEFGTESTEFGLQPPRPEVHFRSLPTRRIPPPRPPPALESLYPTTGKGRPSTSSTKASSESALFSPTSSISGRQSTNTSESGHQSSIEAAAPSKPRRTNPYAVFAPPPSSFNAVAASTESSSSGFGHSVRKALSFTSFRGTPSASTSGSARASTPAQDKRLTRSANGHTQRDGNDSDSSDFELLDVPRDAAFHYAFSANGSNSSLGHHGSRTSFINPRRQMSEGERDGVAFRERTESTWTKKSAKGVKERVLVKSSPCPPVLAVQAWAERFGPVARLQTKSAGVLVEWRTPGAVLQVMGVDAHAVVRKEIELQLRGAGWVKVARA